MSNSTADLPEYRPRPVSGDWLLGHAHDRSEVYRTNKGLVLSNGLIAQTFRVEPNAATVAIDDLMNGEALLRAVGPEAVLEVDGKKVIVGGLQGQPDRAFLFEHWLDELQPIPGSLSYFGFEVSEPTSRDIPWVTTRHKERHDWPPKGKALTLKFRNDRLEADVRYEVYDGIPLIGKQVAVRNLGSEPVHLTGYEVQDLSLVEGQSSVDSTDWRRPPVSVATDYQFAGMDMGIVPQVIHWETEPKYTTQVNYELKTPCRLVVKAPVGPDAILDSATPFTTFTTWMLVHDANERERQSLALRKMYRTLAPWVTESPLMLHLTSVEPDVVHRAIDQAADVGFEMVIFSFGSGLDMEDVSDANIAKFKGYVDYAHSKGVQIGGYSLLASRSIDAADDVIDPKTGKPGGAAFGTSPCLGSAWGQRYFQHIKRFLSATGFDLLEHDGSYPGDVCASTSHPGHRGLADSQATQYKTITDFYHWCRASGIFLNVPDNYFLAGSNKTGMGYRETNWSLPRAQQHIHARQNMFDGTWSKPPTMGWMFTPLVQYQGGGDAATIEPLKEHLEDYGLHLMNNLGFGVQACYRGPRLYDAPETRALVKKWVDWFKAHRDILESDVIHVRRADGRNLDAILHVNPALKTKAMAVIYNPGDKALRQLVTLPLYYSGLGSRATMRVNDGAAREVRLGDGDKFTVDVEVPAKSCAWVTFE